MRFLKDLHYGYRTFLKNPGFTAVAVLSLALGIGANTAIFSFIDSVLLRDLPVREPKQLVLFGKGEGQGLWGGPPEGSMDLFSWRQYQEFRKQNKVFDDVLAFSSMPSRLYTPFNGTQEPVQANLVSGNYFDVLGIQPAAGRFFPQNTDSFLGSSLSAVLNDSFWESHFHRSPSIIGQPITIANRPYTVVGVAPKGFFGTRLGDSPDLWLPLAMQDQMPGFTPALNEPLLHFVDIVGRLKPGVGMKQAEANVNVILHRILSAELGAKTQPGDLAHIARARVELTPGSQGVSKLRARYETPLWILMIVVAVVLVIACANVANLLLALAAKRRKEFAVRAALGASRIRVVRQLLTESLLLSGCGGLLGILLASVAGRVLVHLISTGPRGLPLGFELDGLVLAFTVVVSIATGILFGVIPALRAVRTNLSATLKEGKSSMTSPRRLTLGKVLVAGQVALSLALLVTAGLLLHSFRNLVSLSTGFERDSILLFKLDTESSGHKLDPRLAALYRSVEERVSRLPGVSAEGVSLFSFNEGQVLNSFQAPGVNLPEKTRITGVNYVSAGYFSVLRIPVILGRALNRDDTAGSPPVIVVSESFARGIYGVEANALGRTIQIDSEDRPLQIVGIARDTKASSVRDRDLKTIWRSVYQSPMYVHNLAVRVSGDSTQVAASVRAAIRDADPNLPIQWTTTLAGEVSDSLVRERAIAQLSAFFACLALALSAVGLYGTISFAVSRRTSEIGIRMALGAERVGVLGMVLGDALMLTLAGIVVGLPFAMLAARLMHSMLYGIGTIDTVSVVGAIAVLSLVAAFAGYLPARRAAAVDPMVALRYE